MSDELPTLSEREKELLRLVATGATNQEIARKLFISVNTVKVHLRNIFAKLEVASRTEATMVAVQRGWVAVPRAVEASAPQPLPGEGTVPPSPLALPGLERWPRIPVSKRVLLVVAMILAGFVLFLPQVLLGQAAGRPTDPISGVFPTLTPVAGSAAGRWRTRAPMLTPRNGLAVAAYGGLIYAIGGVSNEGVTGRVEVYDPQSDTWAARSAKPTAVGFVSAGVIGAQIYVPGGIGPDQQYEDVLEVYDPARDAWQSRAPLPARLAGYGLAVLDDRLYLFGGLNEQGYVDSVYRYDPQTDRWQVLKPMDQARGLLGAAALGDQIYVVGGYDDAELDRCEVYDPAAETWTPCPPLEVPRAGLTLVAVRDSVYAIGGGMDNPLTFSERFVSRVGTWSRVETPVTRQWRGLGAAFVDPNIYAMGGWDGSNLNVNKAFQALFYQMIILP